MRPIPRVFALLTGREVVLKTLPDIRTGRERRHQLRGAAGREALRYIGATRCAAIYAAPDARASL